MGDNYFLAQAGYLYRLLHLNPVIGDAIYGSGFYEIGMVWGEAAGTQNLPNALATAVIVSFRLGMNTLESPFSDYDGAGLNTCPGVSDRRTT